MNSSDIARPPAAARLAAERVRLSWRTKLAYGIGGVPNFFGNVTVKSLAVPFYQMTLQLDPALLGLALAIPRIWDALFDPIIGFVSDRTRSRWGRRRPFIVVGALACAVTFTAIWWVPAAWSPSAQLGWFFVTSLLFYSCYTVWSVPFVSLGYELAPGYHDRTRLMAAHGYFLKLAEFGSHWIFPLTQLALFSSVLSGMRWVTLAVGVIIFGFIGLAPATIRERFAAAQTSSAAPRKRAAFFPALAQVFRHRAFVVLLLLTMLKIGVGMFANSLDYYLLVYYVFDGDLTEGSIWKAILTSAAAVIGFLCIRPIVALSERADKPRALMLMYGFFVVTGIVKWFVFRPGNTWVLLLDPLVSAPIWIAMAILMPSMLADICDDDELRTGERREGLFGSVLMWVQQTGVALALFASGAVLNLTGFEVARGAAQDPGVILHIRLVLSGVTAVTGVVAMLVLRCYPLTRATAQATSVALAARRGG